jgi:hypothetical protein
VVASAQGMGDLGALHRIKFAVAVLVNGDETGEYLVPGGVIADHLWVDYGDCRHPAAYPSASDPVGEFTCDPLGRCSHPFDGGCFCCHQ